MPVHLRIPDLRNGGNRNACGAVPFFELPTLDPSDFRDAWRADSATVCDACALVMLALFDSDNLPSLEGQTVTTDD